MQRENYYRDTYTSPRQYVQQPHIQHARRSIHTDNTVRRAPQQCPPRHRHKRRKTKSGGCLLPLVLAVIITSLAVYAAVHIYHKDNAEAVQASAQAAPSDAASALPQTSTDATEGYELQTQPPYTVAIDAGHGGIDTGAEGIINEVDMTEETAADLYALLAADANYNPVLCREAGEGMSIADRVAAATEAQASLLLSIHGNSDFSSDTTGFECFAIPPGRTYYAQSLSFAHCVAAQFESTGAKLRGESGVRYTYYVGTDETGYEKEIAEESDTEIRDDLSFGVLEKGYCPALLVEQCFVTSASDVSRWAGSDGCARAAQLYYNAICEYFGTTPVAA